MEEIKPSSTSRKIWAGLSLAFGMARIATYFALVVGYLANVFFLLDILWSVGIKAGGWELIARVFCLVSLWAGGLLGLFGGLL